MLAGFSHRFLAESGKQLMVCCGWACLMSSFPASAQSAVSNHYQYQPYVNQNWAEPVDNDSYYQPYIPPAYVPDAAVVPQAAYPAPSSPVSTYTDEQAANLSPSAGTQNLPEASENYWNEPLDNDSYYKPYVPPAQAQQVAPAQQPYRAPSQQPYAAPVYQQQQPVYVNPPVQQAAPHGYAPPAQYQYQPQATQPYYQQQPYAAQPQQPYPAGNNANAAAAQYRDNDSQYQQYNTGQYFYDPMYDY